MSNKGVNKVILIGNVGHDPETKEFPNGTLVGKFSMVTSQTWKDKTTQAPREKKEWHKIVVYGKLADIVQKYIKKGSKVYVEGSLQTRKWVDKNNIEHRLTEIVLYGGINGMIQILSYPKNTHQQDSRDNSGHSSDHDDKEPEELYDDLDIENSPF